MHDCYFFSISFFIHYSSLKPHGLDLIEMPWLCSTHGLSARPSFSEQHSEPGWMAQSNCIHIRFFFFLTIHGIGHPVIRITGDSNENAKIIVPWAFSFPLSIVKAQAESREHFFWLSDKPSRAEVYLDSSTGFLILVFAMGKISGSRGPTCSGQK